MYEYLETNIWVLLIGSSDKVCKLQDGLIIQVLYCLSSAIATPCSNTTYANIYHKYHCCKLR